MGGALLVRNVACKMGCSLISKFLRPFGAFFSSLIDFTKMLIYVYL